jgi:hypothetical protein
MAKHWKLIVLPMFYRECPMGNPHWRGNHICYCCEGRERNWTYVWRGSERGWVPVDFALDISQNKHSGLSMSGQLTTSDLIWNGVRTGIVLAILFAIIAWIAYYQIYPTLQKHQKNVQYQYEQVTNNH